MLCFLALACFHCKLRTSCRFLSPAFKVRFPRLVRCLRGWSCLLDGVIGLRLTTQELIEEVDVAPSETAENGDGLDDRQ